MHLMLGIFCLFNNSRHKVAKNFVQIRTPTVLVATTYFRYMNTRTVIHYSVSVSADNFCTSEHSAFPPSI